MESNSKWIGFINPLSSESQELLRENIDLENLFENNKELIDIILNIGEGIFDNDEKIPKNPAELGLKRLEWFFREKNDKQLKINEYSYLYNPQIEKYDIISFHLLAQAIGYKFNINSREVKLFLESQNRLMEERLSRISPELREELINNILSQLSDVTNLKWTDLLSLIETKKIFLEDLLIKNSKVILTEEDFREYYYEDIKNWDERRIKMVYEKIIGKQVKDEIMRQLIITNTEEYLKKIKEKLNIIDIHHSIKKLGELIEEMLNILNEKYSTVYGEILSGGLNGENLKGEKLIKDAFPPCVLSTIEGVKSGNRNDAIVLFLTSFISYSRLHPNVFKLDQHMNLSDFDPNLKITYDEILPIIYEAAENAVPPLFKDQPQEKINITSKLGFGMHNEVELNHEGETKWYTPMSCDKIKMHLSNLCHPDKICKKIGNPITYYSYKKWLLQRDGNSNSKNNEANKKK
ncbi:hypothetical protein [Methanobrevibacter curvatus]|uniref:DNA primase large subunit PriL n=1 Tax=Methanobrevibacter curvatus TaxID=49547 RepID=A0A166CHY3_9EURY|nr:hypothetical protein [Methanobrevibacter curvatus]KZX14537.1 DNA primase large subunit [Methanobrevibacter curvatus]